MSVSKPPSLWDSVIAAEQTERVIYQICTRMLPHSACIPLQCPWSLRSLLTVTPNLFPVPPSLPLLLSCLIIATGHPLMYYIGQTYLLSVFLEQMETLWRHRDLCLLTALPLLSELIGNQYCKHLLWAKCENFTSILPISLYNNVKKWVLVLLAPCSTWEMEARG